MPVIEPLGATVPGATHHLTDLDSARLHHVSAGTGGSPILLVHGWPETWWAFRQLIPLLAGTHRVIAVDLRGFGDSRATDHDYGEAASAEDLHHLIKHLDLGPVHLVCQDISGGVGFRFAATHPDDVLSFTGIETTLAGFGLEALADVNHGGSWHLGFLGTPGIPEILLPGHERELIEGWAYPMMTGVPGSVTEADFDEFLRSYGRPEGWRGTQGLYQALFSDGGKTAALAESNPLTVPVLSIDGFSAPFTQQTLRQLTQQEITSHHLEGVGHLVAQEAPQALADILLDFTGQVDHG
ncbi:alpha/beta hydrolase [Kineosporia sp. NBRC 101731]|uniref:alpha/beta hydrolase n=1 Tax=Kineosporia sp. NBRC 101731 TaxID=3032199 RepID=UPI0024A38504|nr:alpha/beta hydrolase [Kineosporia sp. NBRC 101731]GLY32176.1 alpha/beta hydrolase [Kineosporia sp. NBRC 101731]